MSTFMVTGAGGFIGSHVCDRLLAEGKTVIGVDDLSTGHIANLEEARGYGHRFNFYDLDIRSEGLAQVVAGHAPEVIVHLAAQSGVRPSLADPVHDASVNIIGSLNLLEAAAAGGVRKVVYAASGGTLYGSPTTFPVKERQRASGRPTSPYGISKRAVLDYLDYYRRARGVDFTALALANVYGPRQDPHGEAGVVSIFGEAMLAGDRPVIHGDGSQTRDYVFIDDTVHAFALASGDVASGELLNVATGIETSVTAIYRTLAAIVGFREEPHFEPQADAGVPRSSLDIEQAASKLGWRPWTTLEDGLAETVAFLRGDARADA